MTSDVLAGVRTFRKRIIAEIAVACIGGALVACAIAADQQWFDSHFLPTFFTPRVRYVEMYRRVRVATIVLGALIALIARRPVARFVVESPARALHSALAIVLAFGTAELVLRLRHFRAAQEVPARVEPRRRLDPRLGWVFVPSRRGYQTRGANVVEYAFDRNGYRVRRADEPVDRERPTTVFTGESMMVGERLAWPETIPAQTGAIMAIQTANLAVSGFATDQAYVRLKDELPRFRRPVAVVLLFTPAIFDRNLDDDRPHMGPGLVWLPAVQRWRLAALARRVVRYRSAETIERGIAVTREVLGSMVDLARTRGAVPLIVVPQFGPEEPRERELRRRILDETGLPYAHVNLDPRWRVWANGHPDERAARAIAVAIAARLRDRSLALSMQRSGP